MAFEYGMQPQYGVQIAQPVYNEVPGTTHSNGVTIRRLLNTQEDCAFAANIMVDAFEGKMSYCVTKEKLPILKKAMASYLRNQSPQFYSRNLLAEVDGRPVGYMGLKFKGDTVDDHMDGGCDLGCWHFCRLMCFECVVGESVSSREKCLLEVVGVDASCRGRGVGKALLDRADEEARKEGCKTIYLMVITTNRAISLYERHGYQRKSTEESCCFRCVAGPPGSYHVMEKQL